MTDPTYLYRWFVYVAFVFCALLVVWDLWIRWHAGKQAPPGYGLLADSEPARRTTRPKIVPVRVAVETRPLIAVGASQPSGQIDSAIVIFRNEPVTSHPNANISDVVAEILFHHKGQRVLSIPTGRWGDTEQPAVRKARQPFASLIDLNAVPFRIGEQHELDIAVKYRDQPHLYAFDNSSYDFNDWERPDYRLSEARYQITVRLHGPHLSEEYLFELKNLGSGGGLEFTLIGFAYCPRCGEHIVWEPEPE